MDAIPRIETIFDSRNAISLLFYWTLYKCTSICFKKVFNRKVFESKQRDKKSKKCISSRTYIDRYKIHKKCTLCINNLEDCHTANCIATNNNNVTLKCDCLTNNVCLYVSNNEIFLITLAFTVLPFMPASNLLFYVGFVIAERVLYLPSVGYCFLIAHGYQLASKRFKISMKICLVLVLIVFCVRTVERNKDWLNEESLYRAGIGVNPPKCE